MHGIGGIDGTKACRERVVPPLIAAGRHLVLVVQRHKLGDEIACALAAAGTAARVFRGRGADDPDAPGQKMCRDLERVREIESALGNPAFHACKNPRGQCAHFNDCGYQKQRQQQPDLWIIPAQLLSRERPTFIQCDVVVFIGAFHNAMLHGVDRMRGVDKPVEITLAMLIEGDRKVPDNDKATEALVDVSQGVHAVLAAHPEGWLSRAAFEAAGLTADAAAAAYIHEWQRKRELQVDPGAPVNQYRAACMAVAAHNQRVSKLGRFWRLLNLVSDQFTGLNGITVPGTLRDSLTLLSVVLEQQTELQPTEIMTDTGAYTDTIFGIFHLLGYQFSPRLADIGGTRFWRVDGKADYGALNELAPQRINTALIVQHWEDLLRMAGSLKLGTVQAAGLIRTLQTKDRPTKLARALEELGRLIKTLYLLRFIDDEAYRRRILVQLNRGEGRHQLARIVFHGKRGELRQRYREGQEDQLGALGLVVNVIVLWNTVYMDAALNQLRAESFDVRDEDVARLSPLSFDHVNMLGRYAFILPDQIARSELRPLRDPQNPDDDG